MKTMRSIGRALLLGASLTLAFPAFADKPEWAGGGKHGDKEKHKHEKHEKKAKPQKRSVDGEGAQVELHGYFNERHELAARQYFEERHRAGRCPPGLAKKNNGCMPPGQAKKWAVGKPLPKDVVYYNVPPQLVLKIGHPPAGYRYVRVATDILLIALGTGMVIDAIQDLGNL